jgi:ADP-heptose:LPS heptosyltransferase
VITGLVGDSVMSSPVIVEARRLWPAAELALLGTPMTCALFAACPHIDEFHEALALPYTIRQRRHLSEIRAWLLKRRFDVALIVLGDQFAPLLARSEVPIRVGVRGTALEACLTHTYDIGGPQTWGPRERLRCLEVLGVAVQDTPPRLWVLPEARISGAQRLVSLGINSGEPYIVVHPFGRTERQWWPIDGVPDLARRATEIGYKTVLVGGEETRAAGGAALRLWTADARGLLKVQELVAVVERASVVVSTDSGPFHLAGALGIRTVGLFRASRPEHAGRYPKATVLQGQDAACYGRCDWEHCAWLPCRQMAALSVGQVERTLQQVLAEVPS